MDWRNEYEKLERGERIVELTVDASDRKIPIGFGYLVERDTKKETMRLGAKKKAQRWSVIILGLYVMSTEAWNNTVGLKVGDSKQFWISVDDLPMTLEDDAEQLELILAEDDPALKKKLEEKNAALQAGVEVDSAAKHKAAKEEALAKQKAEEDAEDKGATKKRRGRPRKQKPTG